MASFAIICEGISENLSLHAIIEKMSQTDSFFADLQPRTEMSHGHAVQEGSGGWTEMLSHCNTEEFRMALQNNDYLVVQIDTDRCDEQPFGIKKVDESNQPRTDADVYDDIITRLLQDVDNDFYEANKERIIFAICFDEIECWFLPLFYSDKRACATTGCINKLNQELGKEKGAKARSTYQLILKKIKRKDIPRISQYNFGFQKFVEQMDSIKDEIAETE